jgi:hypothetical protein
MKKLKLNKRTIAGLDLKNSEFKKTEDWDCPSNCDISCGLTLCETECCDKK